MNCNYPECTCPKDDCGNTPCLMTAKEAEFPDPRQNMVDSGLHIGRLKIRRLIAELEGILESTK